MSFGLGFRLPSYMSLSGRGGPTLSCNFMGGALDSRISFSRNSAATSFNSSGVLQSVGSNVPRFDYNPATNALRGLLIEEQRINSIRNNTMQGAVAGTPGTLPTNWGVGTNASGLAWNVVGTGTERGVAYIDLRLSGTSTATTEAFVFFEATTGIAATNGQSWTSSGYVYRTGGGTTNVSSLFLRLTSRITGGASGSWTLNGTNVLSQANSATAIYENRPALSGAISDAAALYVWPLLVVGHGTGAVDITLRIGLPQTEQGASPTSAIQTTNAAVTRLADVASITTLTPWYNSSEGTLFAQFIQSSTDSLANRGIMSLDDNSNNNRVAMFSPGLTSLAVSARVVSGGVATNPANSANFATNAITKSALAYAVGTDQAALCVNGASVTTASPAASPAGVNTLRIGTIFGAPQMGGWMQNIRYFNRRLSNAELQSLTAL